MKERGSTIYFSLVILMTIMGVVLTISLVLVSQLKANKREEHSMIAYYAAESGVEEAFKTVQENIKREGSPSYYDFPHTLYGEIAIGDDTATYLVRVVAGKDSPDEDPYCEKEYYCIRSEGEYRGVKRAIEIGS